MNLRRRQMLSWLGLGGMSLLGTLFLSSCLRSEQSTSESDGRSIQLVDSASSSVNNGGLQRIELDKEAVEVDSQGLIINRYPVTVEGFTEDLGNGVTFTMVQIPEGTFEMGQTQEEEQERIRREEEENIYQRWHRGNELPRHSVNVASFFMGMMTVTQAVYEQVMGENPATRFDGDRFVSPGKPVIGVSWDDAIEFCQKLSERTGKDYRLPSEAEWEYACRAGATSPFHFGPTLTTAIANYDGNDIYGSGPTGEWREQTTSVGSFPPNAFGLHDMHGNVWEWCADYWHNNYNGAPTDGSAWKTGGDSTLRMLRGGSWIFSPWVCRSAVRDGMNIINRNYSIGFRLGMRI